MNQYFSTLLDALGNTLFNPETLVGALFYAVVVFGVAYFLAGTLRRASQKLRRSEQGPIDKAALSFLSQLGRIIIFSLALALYAHLIPSLRLFGTALLASVSVVSIVLGLAAQSTLGNLVAGISLLIYRPFRAGDWLEITTPNGVEIGMVEDLTLGYTILNTLEERRIVIPNSKLTTEVTVNRTMISPQLTLPIYMNLTFATDADRARQLLVELAEAHPNVHEVIECRVATFEFMTAQVLLRVVCTDFLSSRLVTFDIQEDARRLFKEEGIELAYNYRNRNPNRALKRVGKKRK